MGVVRCVVGVVAVVMWVGKSVATEMVGAWLSRAISPPVGVALRVMGVVF